MMERRSIYFIFMISMSFSQPLSASGQRFFQLVESGASAAVSITLCLNAKGPVSCQNETINHLSLKINTLIPHHDYPHAGIKINTQGYVPTGCTFINNGYCLFPVSDTASYSINLSPTTAPLSMNVSHLALATNGAARQIIITNTGSISVDNVTYQLSPGLPAGTTISPASCGSIKPNRTCVLTITPGAVPNAAPGDTNPTPSTLTISSSHSNTLMAAISILTYGSVYQSGYVFAMDDTTPASQSIGGKAASLSDQVPPGTLTAIIWSSDGTVDNVNYADIPGIYDISTAGPNSCNGNSDGACNSKKILAYYLPVTSFPLSFYAAGICSQTIDGYADWYLPAICEMGFDSLNIGSGCGTAAAPAFANMQSNLVDNANIGSLSGTYWSSTEYTKVFGNPANDAWVETFNMGSSSQTGSDKSVNFGVRCVRTLT